MTLPPGRTLFSRSCLSRSTTTWRPTRQRNALLVFVLLILPVLNVRKPPKQLAHAFEKAQISTNHLQRWVVSLLLLLIQSIAVPGPAKGIKMLFHIETLY